MHHEPALVALSTHRYEDAHIMMVSKLFIYKLNKSNHTKK
jgi:hypothetical protein